MEMHIMQKLWNSKKQHFQFAFFFPVEAPASLSQEHIPTEPFYVFLCQDS